MRIFLLAALIAAMFAGLAPRQGLAPFSAAGVTLAPGHLQPA